MKIVPQNEYILLETYEVTREPGKIILPNAPKDTQIYKVIEDHEFYDVGDLLYLKSYPTTIMQGDKKFYLTEEDNVIAIVEV